MKYLSLHPRFPLVRSGIITSASLLFMALAAGCRSESCETTQVRDLDWDDAPRQLGFSPDDFVAAFAPQWRAEVLRERNPFGPPTLDDMVQDWTWSWEPARDEPALYRRRRDGRLSECDVGGWSGEPHMLLLPARVDGESADGAWAYAGRATLAVWALPNQDIPFPLYWMTAFSDMSDESIALIRAPEPFETEAADVLGESQAPPIALRVLGWPGGYGFDLHADLGEGELGPYVGASPWMALTEPL